jgi:hypothetical protein
VPKINWTRAILGGLLAGLIINVVDFVVNGILLEKQWVDGMKRLGLSVDMGPLPMAVFWVAGFMIGLYALWLYVNLRVRYGPGPRTAVIAAVAVWVPACLISSMGPIALRLFSRRLMAIGVAASLVECVLGVLAGAALYKPREEPALKKAAA